MAAWVARKKEEEGGGAGEGKRGRGGRGGKGIDGEKGTGTRREQVVKGRGQCRNENPPHT